LTSKSATTNAVPATNARANKACSRPPCRGDFPPPAAQHRHLAPKRGPRRAAADAHVRPPHTRSTSSRTYQSRVRDAPDAPQRHSLPVRFCVPLLVSWSSRFRASSRNTSFLPTLVSRSPGFCDLPPPSMLALICLMPERQRPSRARRSIRSHTSLARATDSCSPYHRQCSQHRSLWRANAAHALTHPRAANTTGLPRVSCPPLREGDTWPLSHDLACGDPAREPDAQWFERRYSVRVDSPTSEIRRHWTVPDAPQCPPARRASSALPAPRMRPNTAFSRPPCWCDFPPPCVLTVRAVQRVALGGQRLMQAVRPPPTRSTGSRTHQSRVRDVPDVPQRHFPASQFLFAHSGFTLLKAPRSSSQHIIRALAGFSRAWFLRSASKHILVPILVSRAPQFCVCAPPSLLADHTPGPQKLSSRARRSIRSHTSLARATVLRSAPHRQCSPHTRLSHANAAHAPYAPTGRKHNGFATDCSPAAA